MFWSFNESLKRALALAMSQHEFLRRCQMQALDLVCAAQAKPYSAARLNNTIGRKRKSMRPDNLPIIILGLVLAASSCAAEYSLNAAAAAAGKLMPKDGPNEFSLFHLPEPKARPRQLLTGMQQARDQNVCLAICAPKFEYIRDLLKGTMQAAQTEKLDGLSLIIVAEQMAAPGFDELLKGRGIHVKYGAFA